MDRSLLRQLKRHLGLADEAALQMLLSGAREAELPPSVKTLLDGLPGFLGAVDAAYAQYERDLALRTRSLELSSQELTEVNESIRRELASRENALQSLQRVLRDLLPAGEQSGSLLQDTDIAAISRRIAALVVEQQSAQLALSNQKFALDQHAIVSITDTTGRIVYANDRFVDISGYSRDELLGQDHRLVKSGHHPPAFFAGMWDTILQGRVWHGEICNRKRSGELYWVNATIVPLAGPDGLPEQFIAIRTDITDRKRMEGELSDQLHFVEELIEAMPLPVYMKDREGRYIRLNRAFEVFFGVSREGMLGKTLHDLLQPEDAVLHACKDEELYASGGMQTYEAIVHSRDGIAHHTIYRKVALCQRDGTQSGLLGTIIDITERKTAEQAAMRAKEVAEAASRAKSEFLANMSHEIRTPMNGIIGMTDLALDTELTEEQREFLGIVKSSADSLLTIINDILDFSKIEAGRLLVEHISFDLPKVISDTLKTLSLRAYEKNLELIADLNPALPRHVVGDPGRLRQVLINLIGNAIKFTHAGEITLSAQLLSTDGKHLQVQVAVSDTGIGIAPESQERIFDAFAQEDSSTTRRFGGTGLGLSISRRLVELMGGTLWLTSQPGVGSTFSFTVQLRADSPHEEAPHLLPTPELQGRPVLVVDDNESNRRVLSGIVGLWGMPATAVADAAGALAAVAEAASPYACILLDAHMPDMNGYELAAELHRRHPQLPPMLMLSSGAMRGDAQRCQAAGIAGFFAKPIAAEELLAALKRLLAPKTDAPAAPTLMTRHTLREEGRSLDVLVVEDHILNQRLAQTLLEKWGHRMTLAENGQEALELLAGRSFDLILMDMHMPVMGGIEATMEIRRRERESGGKPAVIVAMTAAALPSDREACFEAGMDGYLSKPIKAQDLLDMLNQRADALGPPA